ncbi:iojap-like ribosome-associated protein [Leptolyngbya sp. Heron Island J]|uniref:ribosome silencing factor n=1 Tax=Leptolyngbya sp. Heron Island J TaxID=1385935 RepID=UPI0003B938B1|nr:ribosome silencing factor [Leptolyngbya sp. Heron Island J]ESA35071.1 iojap-like ribosome-associated protein [Leptolyngbya sp. Heron Island J]
MTEALKLDSSGDAIATGQTDTQVDSQTDEQALELAMAIANAADDRKAEDISILQVGDTSYLADYFVIATGFTNVQVRAIARSIESTIETDCGRSPLRIEGAEEGKWVIYDYGEVIAHIFQPREREYYDLEAFWGHVKRIEFIPKPPTSLGP